MSADKMQNLQEVFLNKVRKQHTVVTIFLINGVKLQGIITWFDNFTLLLKRDHHIQMVYKHAVSTVMPMQPVSLFDEEASGEAKQPVATPSADAAQPRA
ncbi:MAG: RNA chaperone Hfq [Proteobacteria bacterium]|nr:RNA chaperone Hfq [Pseudomonadota bacterium]